LDQNDGGYPMDTKLAASSRSDLLCGGRSCAEEARRALALLAGRWVFAILESLHLEGGACRFRPLQRRIGAISQKELTRHLHNLVNAGVVRRCDRGRRDVIYELTSRGTNLLRSAQGLVAWGRELERSPVPATWLDAIAPTP
jgi:DNA-binding HxlR family transcriptional regulator